MSGNGQSELLEVLAGIRPLDAGRVTLGERVMDADHPCDARALRTLGVAHVPEDRLRMGLVAQFDAAEASMLGYHDGPAFNGPVLLHRRRVVADCARKMARFDVRPPDPELKVSGFSGGNQQKLVLAREIDRKPGLLLVGQPTRGVDIGAIEFIHRELVAMRDAGKRGLLVSVELDEIMSLSDRILVMFDGRIVGEVPAGRRRRERPSG